MVLKCGEIALKWFSAELFFGGVGSHAFRVPPLKLEYLFFIASVAIQFSSLDSFTWGGRRFSWEGGGYNPPAHTHSNSGFDFYIALQVYACCLNNNNIYIEH